MWDSSSEGRASRAAVLGPCLIRVFGEVWSLAQGPWNSLVSPDAADLYTRDTPSSSPWGRSTFPTFTSGWTTHVVPQTPSTSLPVWRQRPSLLV